MPVRHPARLRLHIADGIAQVEIDMALEVDDLVAELRETALHADALVARKLHIVWRPRCADGA